MKQAPARVALADIVGSDLDVGAVAAAVSHPSCGGLGLFVGVVRDADHGHGVAALSYTAHPSAVDVLRQVCEAVAERHDVVQVAAVHRVGDLTVGDLAVVVATSAVHRQAALDAARDLIDTLKARVPIWKHQVFADGTDEWVGMP